MGVPRAYPQICAPPKGMKTGEFSTERFTDDAA